MTQPETVSHPICVKASRQSFPTWISRPANAPKMEMEVDSQERGRCSPRQSDKGVVKLIAAGLKTII